MKIPRRYPLDPEAPLKPARWAICIRAAQGHLRRISFHRLVHTADVGEVNERSYISAGRWLGKAEWL